MMSDNPAGCGQFLKPDALLNPEKVEFCSKAVSELEKIKDMLQKELEQVQVSFEQLKHPKTGEIRKFATEHHTIKYSGHNTRGIAYCSSHTKTSSCCLLARKGLACFGCIDRTLRSCIVVIFCKSFLLFLHWIFQSSKCSCLTKIS